METGHLQIPLSQADYKYSFFAFLETIPFLFHH